MDLAVGRGVLTALARWALISTVVDTAVLVVLTVILLSGPAVAVEAVPQGMRVTAAAAAAVMVVPEAQVIQAAAAAAAVLRPPPVPHAVEAGGEVPVSTVQYHPLPVLAVPRPWVVEAAAEVVQEVALVASMAVRVVYTVPVRVAAPTLLVRARPLTAQFGLSLPATHASSRAARAQLNG